MDQGDMPRPDAKEIGQPKIVVFNQIACPENPHISIDEKDLAIKREGLTRYQKLFSPRLSHEQRKFLLIQDVLSTTVGFQAEATMSTPYIAAWINAMHRAGMDYTKDYGLFFASGQFYNRETQQVEKPSEPFWEIINLRQMEHILSIHPQIFGLDETVRFPMDKDELIQQYERIRATENDESFHLRLGLLSGYPLGDCHRWNEVQAYRPRVAQVRPATIDQQQQLAEYAQSHSDILPQPDDDTFDEDTTIHPNNRGNKNRDPSIVYAGSYGIGWATKLSTSGNPPSDTVAYCQRLLRIDNELGIESFVNSQKALLAT